MASFAEMIFQSASDQTDPSKIVKAGNMAQAFTQGAELAQRKEQIQLQRDELQRKQQEVEMGKFDKVGSWFETAAKMPDGKEKQIFMKEFIPRGMNALGLDDKINPLSMKMLTSDSTLGNYFVSKVRSGDMSYPQLLETLKSPDKMAAMVADAKAQGNAELFGNEENVKGTIEGYMGSLSDADKFATSEEGKAARAAKVAGAQQGQRGFSNENELRNQFTKLKTTEDTRTIFNSYKQARDVLSNKPSAVGDMKLIYTVMKAYVPGSTVREGEFASAVKAGNIVLPAELSAVFNKVSEGGLLDSKTRKQFFNQVEDSYRSSYQSYANTRKTYENIAKAQGINPANIFTDKFGAPPPKKGTKMVDVGGTKMTEEQAKRFYEANPQFKPKE